MGLLGGRPYTKQISRSKLQGFLDKTASFKGKRGLHADEFKELLQSNPKFKDRNLSRIAHNIYKEMKGVGPRDIKIKTHHAKQFAKAFGEAVQKAGESGSGIRLTKFGRKKMHESPKAGFQKYVVEKEIAGQAPQGPTEEQTLAEKRRKIAMQNLNRYQRAKEIEAEQGRFALHREDREKEKKTNDNQSPNTSESKTPPLSFGSSSGRATKKQRDFEVDIPRREGGNPQKKAPQLEPEEPTETENKETFEEPSDEGLFE